MEIVWNALQKRRSVCACFCWWLFCAWCTNCNIRTDRARWALANAAGILFQLPESTATWWGENGREVCDLLLPTWYDVMMDTRITWEKNDNFYSRLTGVPSGDPGGGDSILRNTCRILPDGDNLCETTDHLLFPFSLLGGLVTNSFVWCLVWLMHWHVAACWVTRPTAIRQQSYMMASLWLRRLYRLHYVVTWPLSCASRNVLGWIYSHVWLCMTV